MTFKPPTEQAPRLSFSYSSMITAVSTNQEDIPISAFKIDGYPIYPAKLNSHFLWYTSEAHMCDLGCPCLDDYDSDDDYLHLWLSNLLPCFLEILIRKGKTIIIVHFYPYTKYALHLPLRGSCASENSVITTNQIKSTAVRPVRHPFHPLVFGVFG